MAPIHHHFELKGWAEPKVIVRFWIITRDPRADRPRDAEACDERTRHRSSRRAARGWSSGSAAPALSCARYLRRARASTSRVTDTRAQPPGLAALRELVPAWSCASGAFDAALLDDACAGRRLAGRVAARSRSCVEARGARHCRSSATSSCSRARRRRRSSAITGTQRQEHGHDARRGASRTRPGAARSPAAISASRRSTCSDATDAGAVRARSCRASSSRRRSRCARAAATVLNVTPDHMDRYASVGEYAAAKARIFERLRSRGRQLSTIQLRASDAAHGAARAVAFSLRIAGADYYALAASRARCVAAARRARCCRSSRAADRTACTTPPTRWRRWRCARRSALPRARVARRAARLSRAAAPLRSGSPTCGGVRYVNDSKGTNVGATVAAVGGHARPACRSSPAATARTRISRRSPRLSAARCGTSC